MEQNKTGKYFKYAIGEIILVVIGILIALQINNWNEDRKTKSKSDIYVDKIINDLIQDTLNINDLIRRSNINEESISDYFSFFDKGNIPIDILIDSSRNVLTSYYRYIPVNHTFLDMQASGNSSLLSERQREVLIQLGSEQEQLIIIIEKLISRSIKESDEKNKYLGFPENFYQKLGKPISESKKTQWLIHAHLDLEARSDLYFLMESRGNRIKEKSREAIQILKNELKDD